jgi:pyridoxal phosphate enzyme (YggS family)
MDIKTNLASTQERIKAAQDRSNNAADEVLLLAVSKTFAPDVIQKALDAGQYDLGENKVQEIQNKFPVLPAARWHMIGHLQTNKVRHLIDKVVMIHSLDRIDLAKEINKRAQNANLIMPCLVQVNIAEDEKKFGLAENELIDFLQAMTDYPALCVEGLMTIGPYCSDPEEVRPLFANLRKLRDKIAGLGIPDVEMKPLSMGMSGDYEVAVEEGATIVRVGSGIFGARNYNI